MEKESFFKKLARGIKFKERRKGARLDASFPIRYRILGRKDEKEAVTRNISVGGCLLISREDIMVDTRLDMEIYLPEGKISPKGRVLRLNCKRGSGFEFGVVFDEMDEKGRELLAESCFSQVFSGMEG